MKNNMKRQVLKFRLGSLKFKLFPTKTTICKEMLKRLSDSRYEDSISLEEFKKICEFDELISND